MENCAVNLSGQAVYDRENQELCDFILQEQFYKYFHKSNKDPNKNDRTVELVISPKCNLGCKYCYVHRHRDKLFDDDCFDEEKTIENLKLILEWLRVNEFNPNLEIFSGELFAQEVGYKVLDVIIDYYRSVDPELRGRFIIIPTNFTFLLSEEYTARVEEIRKNLDEMGIALLLSASFDGKYMEQNRPYLHDLDLPIGAEKVRDDEYYDKCFQYCRDTYSGFHPMVYSKGIELWPKNFDWFQAKFKEFDLPWDALYLLQVRNLEWNTQQIKDMQKFIMHLYKFVYEMCDGDRGEVVEQVIHQNVFNMLSQPFTTTGRGLTCGIQSQFIVRVSDMMAYPCHRTGYKDFYYGQFVPDPDKVLKLKCTNPEILCMTFSIHKEDQPYCAQCPINQMCTGQCLGAQYENNTNLLVPVPSVCALTYAMAIAGIQGMREYGSVGLLKASVNKTILNQINYLERVAKC